MADVTSIQRRRSPRIHCCQPVTLKAAGLQIQAESRNISDKGIFVIAPAAVDIGSPADVEFTFSTHEFLRCDIPVRAEGAVVRIETLPANRFGIALELRRIRFG